MTDSLEKFAYKLVIANNTDAEITGFKVIDVFPHLDDTALVLNQEGVRMPRESQFQNTFDWETGVTVPAGYTVYYLNEPVGAITGNLEDFEATLNWQTVGNAQTSAIKVVANDGVVVGANSSVEIIVPMIAPENTDLQLSGKRRTTPSPERITNSEVMLSRIVSTMKCSCRRENHTNEGCP